MKFLICNAENSGTSSVKIISVSEELVLSLQSDRYNRYTLRDWQKRQGRKRQQA